MKVNNDPDSDNSWPIKISEYLSYFYVAIIPLFFATDHFNIFNSPKILLIHLLTLLICIFFFFVKIKSKDTKISFSNLHIILFIFLGILTLSSILGVDPINSFLGWNDVTPLVTIYMLSLFCIFLGYLFKKNRKILLNVLIVSLATSVLTVIIFYTGIKGASYIKEGSTLGNSSYLGGYLLFNFIFGLGLFSYFKKWWKKIIIFIAIIFITINPLFINKDFLLGKIGLLGIFQNPTILLGIANGATIGLVISLITIGLLYISISKKRIINILGLFSIIFLITGMFFIGKEITETDSYLNKVFIEQKTGNRFLAWDISKQEFISNPILGIGYNNYIYSFERYYNPKLYKKDYALERLTYPHNVFWEFTSNNGILGIVAYLALLVTTFIYLYNDRNEEDGKFKNIKIILAGLILGYFVQNLFVFDTVNTYMTLFILIAVAIGFSDHYSYRFNAKYLTFKRIILILFILLCIYSIKIFVFAPWKESVGMNKIMGTNTDIESFVSLRYKLQEESIFMGVMDDTDQYRKIYNIYQSNLNKINDKNKNIFLKELLSIINYLENDIKRQPNYSESYLTVSKMCNLYLLAQMKEGDSIKFKEANFDEEIWNKSYNSLMKSIELNNNNPQTYLILSQLYLIKHDFTNAILFAKKSIILAPENKDGYDFSNNLLKIVKDKDFDKFITEMENKYLR